MKRSRFFLASVLSAAIAAPGGARGQVDTIVVTAQKREESAQDVPIALQAINGEALQERNVSDADQILNIFPNLSSNASNDVNKGFSIRGIGTLNAHGNVNQAVGIYYDEVTQATPYSSVLGVFDMERIEVLRGPQNTLFGKNTTGGAINYISKKPELGAGVSGYGKLTYGSFDRLDGEGAINLGLSDEAGLRVSFQSVNRDGPFTNLAAATSGGPEKLGKRERHSGRAQLLWAPGDATDVLLNFHIGRNRGNPVGNKARGLRDPADPSATCAEVATSADFSATNSCVDLNGDNPSTSKWLEVYNTTPAVSDVDVTGGFVKISHDFGWASLVSITSYDRTKVLFSDDIGGNPTLQFTLTQDTVFDHYSQELRLVSPSDAAFRWIAGFFYFKEGLLQGTSVRRDVNGSATPGGEVTAVNILDQNARDFSGYGQIEYDLTDRLTFSGGVRYTNVDKSADSLFGVAITPAALYPTGTTIINRNFVLGLLDGAPETCPPGPPGVDPDTGRAFGGPPPCRLPVLMPTQTLGRIGARASLDYAVTDNVMVYASYSRGFKAGGFDTRALAAFNGDAGRPVGPELLNAYEIGWKSNLFANSLVFNGALFYYDQNDLQTFATIGGIPGFYNIPKSEVLGVELEATWALTDTTLVQAGFGYLDTEITDNGGLAGIDEGHVLPNAPQTTFNILAAQDIPLEFGDLRLQADARYVSEQIRTLEFAEDFLSTKEEQFYVNVRAAFSFGPERQYEIAAFGENLTGEIHCSDIGLIDTVGPVTTSALSTTLQCAPATLGRPTWGVSVKAAF